MSFKNILIIRTDRIGDVVLTTPAISALRKAFPLAKISVLVAPSTVDLVNHHPDIHEVLVDARYAQHQGFRGFWRLVNAIKEQQFDLVINYHPKKRSNLLCFCAGIPYRLGYKNNKLGFLLTHPVKDDRHLGQKHEAQYCLDLLQAIDVHAQATALSIPIQKEAHLWVDLWKQKNKLDRPLAVLHPDASDASKCWPTQSFAELADRLTLDKGMIVVLVGGADAKPLGEAIERLMQKQCCNLIGQTSVAQMAALLQQSAVMISNDSGPVHVGAAVGTPVISLFLRNQPGINPERWKPLGEHSSVLCNKLGEEIMLDARGNVASGKFDSITVDEVFNTVNQLC